jgi:hypothetical protein
MLSDDAYDMNLQGCTGTPEMPARMDSVTVIAAKLVARGGWIVTLRLAAHIVSSEVWPPERVG